MPQLLVFVSLTTRDINNLFVYSVIHESSFVKFLFKSFAYFSAGLFPSLTLRYRNLYTFHPSKERVSL